MNEDLTDLELELTALRPRSIAPSLALRVAIGLHARRTAQRAFWRGVSWAAVAALVFGLLSWSAQRLQPLAVAKPGTGVRGADGNYKPVAAQNFYLGSSDDGLIALDGGVPAWRIRSYFVDTITWRDPATKASVSWTLPREEVRVWPASVH
jgi:hypothetical protein